MPKRHKLKKQHKKAHDKIVLTTKRRMHVVPFFEENAQDGFLIEDGHNFQCKESEINDEVSAGNPCCIDQ